jgi:hypothetical protein
MFTAKAVIKSFSPVVWALAGDVINVAAAAAASIHLLVFVVT